VDNDTSIGAGTLHIHSAVVPLTQLAASVAFVLKIASASVAETRRGVLQLTSSTGSTVIAGADTTLHALAPEVKARLDSILDRVRGEIIEDGMTNTIALKLPQLVADHYRSVLPAIAALTDGRRTSATVTAELLKEVGRLRNAASHLDRRWLLEHALWSPNPAARDGAAVGLAWLQDPGAAPSVRIAAEREQIPQLRADLEEVFRLLMGTNDNGLASQNHET
jgi:hypothetical protein